MFTPSASEGNVTLADLAKPTISDEMAEALTCAPSGKCMVGDMAAVDDEAVVIEFPPKGSEVHFCVYIGTAANALSVASVATLCYVAAIMRARHTESMCGGIVKCCGLARDQRRVSKEWA